MKIGVVGSGFGLYGLLPAFNSIDGCTVVSVCGKKTERFQSYCKSIDLNNLYSDWKEMISNEKIDALAIAVTPEAQYEIAKYALKRGIHVFAEKPLAVTYLQAKELFLIAKKNNCITAVDFIFPEIDEWVKVKKILNEETYGKLLNISVNWTFLGYDIKNKTSTWKTNVKKGGGALSFYFSHVLYYLEYYSGEISKISSSLTYSYLHGKKIETGVDVLLKFKNKVTAQAHLSSDSKGFNFHQVVFMCEKATIVIENTKGVTENFSLKVFSQDQEFCIVDKSKQKSKMGEDERVLVVSRIAKRFIQGVKNKKEITPSFVDGVRVQKLIELVRSSEF